MKRNALVMLAMLFVFVATAQGQESNRTPTVEYLAETGGAVLGGGLVGGGAGALLGLAGYALLNNPRGDWMWGAIGATYGFIAGAALGYPAGCGLGTNVAGRALGVDGNTGLAYTGAIAGMGMGALALFIPRSYNVQVALVAMGALTPAGAVIGYNIGASRESSPSSFGARVSLPAVAFSVRSSRDRQSYTVVDCRLITTRF